MSKRASSESMSLRKAWMNLGKKATRSQANVDSRLHWGGLPNEERDPLMLAGMELRLSWRERGTPIENEVIVSIISIVKFLGSFTDPKNPAITWNDYRLQIMQSTEPNSHYQQLLSQQKSVGIRPEASASVTIQEYRARIKVGPPTKDLQGAFYLQFKINLPSVTLMDGILFKPVDVPVDELGNFPIINATRREKLKGLPGNLVDQMSDLVIDRIFELQGMVAEWLQDRKGNRERRLKKSAKAIVTLQVALASKRGLCEAVKLTTEAISSKTAELVALRKTIEAPNTVEHSSISDIQQCLSDTQAFLTVATTELTIATAEDAKSLRKWGLGSRPYTQVHLLTIEAREKVRNLQQALLNSEIALREQRERIAQLQREEEVATLETIRLAEQDLNSLETLLTEHTSSLAKAQVNTERAKHAAEDLT